jgi:hypothetical protein
MPCRWKVGATPTSRRPRVQSACRVSVDHRRALSHHLVACERDNHEMARFRQIGGEAFGINRLVEDVYGNAMEDCSIVKG